MIANRPLIYLTLPSLALIIGYVWLRRKKGGRAVCDSGGGENKQNSRVKLDDKKINSSYKLVDSPGLNDQLEIYSSAHNSHHSESLPIGKISSQQQQINKQRNDSHSSLLDQDQRSQSPQGSTGSNSSSTSSLCKSAPIDIVPNPRSPPKRVTEQDVDTAIKELIPQESDIKNLRYIEEPEIDWNESPTPADSPLYRDRFDLNRSQPKVEPVVIKGTQEAKVSPENSFRERKYTQTESDDCGGVVDTTNTNTNQNINGNEIIKMNEVIDNVSNAPSAALTDSGCDAEVVATNDNSTTAAVVRSQPQISSPALSVCSMRSGDSGQGSSPPQSICAPQISYEFLIPTTFIGALIGPRGRIITEIKEKTGANVIIQKSTHGSLKRQKVCSVEGTQSEVEAALKLIRSTLPEKRYRALTMERIFVTPDNHVAPMPIFNTSTLTLQLIEQINNDVVISTVVGGRLFLHQPLHPTYPVLSALQNNMNQWYSLTAAPELPEVIENAICAVCVQDNWYRVQILSRDIQAKTCHVKYLDFGGYSTVLWSELKQIHANFMTLPFQIIECVLSNIRPLNNGEWSKEIEETIQNLTKGVIVQAQVAGYTDDDLPEIYLFRSISKDNVLFLNQELCARNLAEWIPEQDV